MEMKKIATRSAQAGTLSVGYCAGALAALPVAATDAITLVQTDGVSLIALVWVVAGLITGGLVVLGMFKRAISRA